jgi:hypothetical protein
MATRKGGPVRFLGDELIDSERACLLRAAREKLERLQREKASLEQLSSMYAVAPMEVVQAEIDCLARAVAWLWREQTKPK